MQILNTAISLPVANPQRTRDFYARVFGVEAVNLEENTVSLELAGFVFFFIECEEFNLLLKPADTEAHFSTGAFTSMLSVTAGSKDELYTSLKSAQEGGGTPCGQAVSYPWGLAAYFKDPDEHLWEILWRDPK